MIIETPLQRQLSRIAAKYATFLFTTTIIAHYRSFIMCTLPPLDLARLYDDCDCDLISLALLIYGSLLAVARLTGRRFSCFLACFCPRHLEKVCIPGVKSAVTSLFVFVLRYTQCIAV